MGYFHSFLLGPREFSSKYHIATSKYWNSTWRATSHINIPPTCWFCLPSWESVNRSMNLIKSMGLPSSYYLFMEIIDTGSTTLILALTCICHCIAKFGGGRHSGTSYTSPQGKMSMDILYAWGILNSNSIDRGGFHSCNCWYIKQLKEHNMDNGMPSEKFGQLSWDKVRASVATVSAFSF